MHEPAHDPALEAQTDGAVVEAINGMRHLADRYAHLPYHQAAVTLADEFLARLDPKVIAASLANVLLTEARQQELPPLVSTDDLATATATIATEPAGFDPLYAGVELRVIGPEGACRRALASIAAGPVKLTGFRGPLPAHQRHDLPAGEAVRFYAYTDEDTKRNARRTERRYRRTNQKGTTTE